MSQCSTLAPEGLIQAYWSRLKKGVSSLTLWTARSSRELEVVKEPVTVPCRAKVGIKIPDHGQGGKAAFPTGLQPGVPCR